jgi:hypothetical protein
MAQEQAPAGVVDELTVAPPGHPVPVGDQLEPAAAGVEVETVGERLARVAAVGRATRAPATLRACQSDWAHF